MLGDMGGLLSRLFQENCIHHGCSVMCEKYHNQLSGKTYPVTEPLNMTVLLSFVEFSNPPMRQMITHGPCFNDGSDLSWSVFCLSARWHEPKHKKGSLQSRAVLDVWAWREHGGITVDLLSEGRLPLCPLSFPTRDFLEGKQTKWEHWCPWDPLCSVCHLL